MKKNQKFNLKDIFTKWFWWWLGITIVLLIIIAIVQTQPFVSYLSATIMALFMLMPIRDWMYKIMDWAIDFLSSNNTAIKDYFNPKATMNPIDATNGERVRNTVFYDALFTLSLYITTILALLWLVFPNAAFNVVYAWLHTLEFFFTGRIAWWRILVYMLLLPTFFYGAYIAIGEFLEGKVYYDNGKIDFEHNWWKFVLMFVGFYGFIIIGDALLAYTGSMIWSSCCFWSIVVGSAIIGLKIWMFLRKRKYKRNHQNGN